MWRLAYVTKEAGNVVEEVRLCGSARPQTPQALDVGVWAINADMQQGALAVAGRLTPATNGWKDGEAVRAIISAAADSLKQ